MTNKTLLPSPVRDSKLLRTVVRPAYRRLRSLPQTLGQTFFRLRHTVSKAEFIRGIHDATASGSGYATGKLGNSEQYWMYYPVVLERESDPKVVRAYEAELEHHFLKNTGLFPYDLGFIREYNSFYVEQVRQLDCIGIFHYYPREKELVRHYGLKNKLTFFANQEPDRWAPMVKRGCYLPYFRDKRVLIICPFAEVLAQRATREIFEGVWSNYGKEWFYPRSVTALEFPYGFAPDTQEKFGNAFKLLDTIKHEIDRREFDVALIAAAGLAIPIATHIKQQGKIAISLGGILQILFGVQGQRWRDNQHWTQRYWNSWWIDMPEKYRPVQKDVCDRGAYW